MIDDSNSDQPGSAVSDDLASNAFDIVTDLVTGTSIPSPIKRNALKAFGRLCTAAIEIPVAYLEGIAAEKRAETQGRIKIIGRTTEQIAQQMEIDPEYARVAVRKFGQKVIREQVNLDMISEIAANAIKETSSQSEQMQNNGEPEKSISDDWLNTFEKEACQKSTEEIQLLFGRILAGEIKRPASFSLKTIKILANLDPVAAALFKRFCSACVVLQIPGANHIIDARVPSLGGDAGSNSLSKYGFSFGQLNILEEYGLIMSQYNSWSDYKHCIVNHQKQVFLPLLHQGKQWALVPTPERPVDQELKLSGVALSRSGQELMQIIDIEPMGEYTEALRAFLESSKLQMVEITAKA